MSFQVLQPREWPRPNGYSNGIATRGLSIFIAGQVGWDANGHFTDASLAGQVRQALLNIKSVLAEAGAEPRHIVRLTWYLTSRDEYRAELAAIGAAYREVIGRHYPAMSACKSSR